MTAAIYHKRLERVLDRMGGLYALNDILERIAAGKMQSFVEGNSWAICELNDFPRRRVLDILAVVGDLKDCRILHDQVLRYADRVNASLVRASGRRGWIKDAESRGWRRHTTNMVYVRDM